ncbi:hypothetical protein MADMEL_193 [Erwinia phage vB_EamM_MadMel]|uniref:Uncharacterized protein n=1 Tax=Erwinia phage vB_EamM_MadMel TaxID=2060128 RepID=A0A2H5BJZ7_9CAUD|nr:hypothetical protein MADMEL_193 [Erwinia phage vB_EamM_MadMel]
MTDHNKDTLMKPGDVKALFANNEHVNLPTLISEVRGLFTLLCNEPENARFLWFPDHASVLSWVGQFSVQLKVYFSGEIEVSINTELGASVIGQERANALVFVDRILPLTGYYANITHWPAKEGHGEIILIQYLLKAPSADV